MRRRILVFASALAIVVLAAPAERGQRRGHERASDPWVSFGRDGTAYQMALSIDVSTADPTRRGHAYAVWDRVELTEDLQAFRGPTLFTRTSRLGLVTLH